MVAPWPVGAPFATSKLGNVAVRDPATPSMVNRPCTGSNWPVWPTTAAICGLVKVAPPSADRCSISTLLFRRTLKLSYIR